MTCPLCLDPWPTDEICPWCEVVMFEAGEIVRIYSEARPPIEASVPDEIRSIVREIDFTFERDPRVRKYFNVAYEVVEKSLEFEENAVPLSQLRETRGRSPAQLQDIFSVLTTARIASLVGDRVVSDEMSQRITQLLPLTNPLEPKDELKGLLCVVLANQQFRRWQEGNAIDWRPLRYLLYEKGLAVHLLRNLNRTDMPKSVSFDDFFDSLHYMSQTSRLRAFKEDVIFGNRLFEAFPKTPSGRRRLALKEGIWKSQIWWRERWRERERERGR